MNKVEKLFLCLFIGGMADLHYSMGHDTDARYVIIVLLVTVLMLLLFVVSGDEL